MLGQQFTGLMWTVAALLCGPLSAMEVEDGTVVSQDFTDSKAELENMVNSRQTDVYELDFKPLAFDRIVLKDRLGVEQEHHYFLFRIVNRVSDNAQYLLEHAARYNEVLDAITQQYQALDVNLKKDPQGGKLSVEFKEGVTEEGMRTIVERQDLKVQSRKINLTILAWDENGSRIRSLDPVPGEGPQELFNFPDLGQASFGHYSTRIKEAIEDHVGRRLHTVREIRAMDIPPYDASKVDPEGVAQGMIYGVFIFERLPIEGDVFTVQVNGLSNKVRFKVPAHEKNQIADYFNTRVLRRTYMLTYDRIGDEYFHDLDRFTLKDHGWRWVNTFQRLRQRKAKAYTEYFLDNIRLDEERTTRITYEYRDENDEAKTEQVDGPVLHDEAVAKEFWPYTDVVRGEEIPGVYDAKREILDARRGAVENHYKEEIEARTVEEEVAPLRTRLQERLGEIDARLRSLEEAKTTLPTRLPDFKQKLEEK